ncbi:MAG: sigma-70 family RNA polymerase sigma factor, partial [Thermomicrobiales bacterium]
MNVSDLVLLARTGDVEAFTELVRRYQAMAFGYAYAQLGDFQLAEDAAQQAFITAYCGLPKLRQPERFGGWLRTIVRYECLHLMRSHPGSSHPIEHADHLVDGVDPVRWSEGREGVDRVLTVITALPQPEREVTVLYYLHEYSQREVAAFLDLPVTTVNNRLRTARAALRKGLILPMANDAFHDHRLPDSFAMRIGEIVRTHGPLVDARFDAQQRPQVLNALTVTDETADPLVTVEAIQFLNDTLVRCIAITEGATQIDAGMRVRDTGGPVRTPLDRAAIEHIIATVPPSASAEIMETGIKAIDLFCPIPRAGRIALIGDMQVGKMVLVEELIHRLVESSAELSILVFVETPDEVTVVNAQEYRASTQVAAVYLPVADAGPAALGDLTAELDAVITFSRELGQRRLYPAIDPVRSTSRLLNPDMVGPEHVAIANRVRALLQEGSGERAASDR